MKRRVWLERSRSVRKTREVVGVGVAVVGERVAGLTIAAGVRVCLHTQEATYRFTIDDTHQGVIGTGVAREARGVAQSGHTSIATGLRRGPFKSVGRLCF